MDCLFTGEYSTSDDEDCGDAPLTSASAMVAPEESTSVAAAHGDWDVSSNWSECQPPSNCVNAPPRSGFTAKDSSHAPPPGDILEAWEERRWEAMRVAGHSPEHIAKARSAHADRERTTMLLLVEKSSAGTFDSVATGLELGRLLVKAGQGYRALDALARARTRSPASTALGLAAAKLLFKEDRKSDAAAACRDVIALAASALDDGAGSAAKDAAEAHYLLGWIDVHAGCHSRAYATWINGAAACPTDARLAKQRAKRHCWDEEGAEGEDGAAVALLIGAGAHGDGAFDRERDFDAFKIAPDVAEPALRIYDSAEQKRRAVFRTRAPLLSAEECARVVAIADEHSGGAWGTVRHSSVPTTDIAVEDIPALRPWLRELLRTRLFPMLATCFPLLADGTTLGARGERLRVHDAFIVRYDAERDMSLSLPAHSDTSAVSFTLALNGDCAGGVGDSHYRGGGTWYKAVAASSDAAAGRDAAGAVQGGADASRSARGVVNASEGNAVAFIGPLRHAGHPITAGTRLILVLFLYVEGFEYGRFVGYDGEPQQCDAEHSETGENSFVVYKETHALLSARAAESAEEAAAAAAPRPVYSYNGSAH